MLEEIWNPDDHPKPWKKHCSSCGKLSEIIDDEKELIDKKTKRLASTEL